MTNKGVLAILGAVLAALMLSPTSVGAVACTLDTTGHVDLVTFSNGCSITVGDKTFTGTGGLSYNPQPPNGNFSPPSATGILVRGVSGSGLFGLEFSGSMSVSGGNQSLDILFGYTVVASAGLISDIHMSFNAGFTGDGHASVTEDVKTALVGGTNIGHAQVTNPPPGFDTTVFLSQQLAQVFVTKDIQLTSGPTGTAFVSSIDQFVSQTVPEPASLLLLGSGLVALCIITARRRLVH